MTNRVTIPALKPGQMRAKRWKDEQGDYHAWPTNNITVYDRKMVESLWPSGRIKTLIGDSNVRMLGIVFADSAGREYEYIGNLKWNGEPPPKAAPAPTAAPKGAMTFAMACNARGYSPDRIGLRAGWDLALWAAGQK